MKDQRKRSIVKAISWRIIATLTTMTIVFLFTGELSLAAGVGVLDVISKLIFYYVHERGWNLVSWGKSKEK